MTGGAGKVRVAEGVAGPVDSRPLAIPHAEHAIETALAAQFGLLRAPQGGRSEVLVGGGVKPDVVLREDGTRAHELLVERAERGAAIAGHVAGRVETGPAVALLLHQREADEGLKAGHEDAVFAKVIFVVEADRLERHGAFSATRKRRLFCRDIVAVQFS